MIIMGGKMHTECFCFPPSVHGIAEIAVWWYPYPPDEMGISPDDLGTRIHWILKLEDLPACSERPEPPEGPAFDLIRQNAPPPKLKYWTAAYGATTGLVHDATDKSVTVAVPVDYAAALKFLTDFRDSLRAAVNIGSIVPLMTTVLTDVLVESLDFDDDLKGGALKVNKHKDLTGKCLCSDDDS